MKIKKLHPNAVIPSLATKGSNGYDLTAVEIKFEEDPFGLNNLMVCNTGLAIQVPKGFTGFLMPRSSVSKYPFSLANSVGLLDQDYLGSVVFKFRYTGNTNIHWTRCGYKVGERIGQLVVVKCEQPEILIVDELELTDRNTGGFGSTGA